MTALQQSQVWVLNFHMEGNGVSNLSHRRNSMVRNLALYMSPSSSAPHF